MLSEGAIKNIDKLKDIPFEIIEFWKKQINEKTELNISVLDDIIYYTLSLKKEFRDPHFFHIEDSLAFKYRDSAIMYLISKNGFIYLPYYEKEALQQLHLKAFW